VTFKRAERKNVRIRLAVSGTSGSGKTYSSLLLAKEFGQKIAVLDSERGSASLYAELPGIPPFDVCELDEHVIQTYLEKIAEAAANGYDVLVIDSFSHSWMATLEVVTQMGGWARAGKAISPLTEKLVNVVLNYPGHVIATFRSKTEYALEQNDKGKTGMRKIGLAPVARPDTEYEFTAWLEFDREGVISVSKSRCGEHLPVGKIYRREDLARVAASLKAWMAAGAPVTPRDAVMEKIRFAGSDDALKALAPEIAALSVEDRKFLKSLYDVKKAQFAEEAVV
jgi:hypothetical protein